MMSSRNNLQRPPRPFLESRIHCAFPGSVRVTETDTPGPAAATVQRPHGTARDPAGVYTLFVSPDFRALWAQAYTSSTH